MDVPHSMLAEEVLKVADRVFKVFNVESLDDKEIQVKIKIKINYWPV